MNIKWAKYCPKHVELILWINKLLLHLVGSSILLYLHWWCTVKHKSSLRNKFFLAYFEPLSFRTLSLVKCLRIQSLTCFRESIRILSEVKKERNLINWAYSSGFRPQCTCTLPIDKWKPIVLVTLRHSVLRYVNERRSLCHPVPREVQKIFNNVSFRDVSNLASL